MGEDKDQEDYYSSSSSSPSYDNYLTSILYSSSSDYYPRTTTLETEGESESDLDIINNPMMDSVTEDPPLLNEIGSNFTTISSTVATSSVLFNESAGGGSSPNNPWNESIPFLPTLIPTGGTTPSPSSPEIGIDCTSAIDYDYDPLRALLCIGLFFFGIFYCIFGYRCYKSVLFLTGFIFAVVVVFLICQVEDLLPQYANVGISLLAGVLFGLICLLVPYVGFFTIGFHAGVLLGLASMSLFFKSGYSVWISVIFLLGTGLIGAIANVCWPSLSIATTSLLGGAAISISFDYFVEKCRMAAWIGQLVKEEKEFCWFSWLLLILWPVLLGVGVLVQMTLTANGGSVHIYGYHDSKRNLPRRRMTREERALARQAKYRYLYQVRTAGGDYISQAYIQFLQNKKASPHADTLSTHLSTLQTSSTQEESTAN